MMKIGSLDEKPKAWPKTEEKTGENNKKGLYLKNEVVNFSKEVRLYLLIPAFLLYNSELDHRNNCFLTRFSKGHIYLKTFIST